MNIGDHFQCEITACGFGGDGIARHEGMTVFVPGALPGELVVAELTGIRKSFWRARPVRFGQTSPERVVPECPYAGRCPGCAYSHCSFDLENRLKLAQLDNFPGAGKIAPRPVIAPEPVFGYRNKLVLHVRKVGKETEIGYVADDGGHIVCDIESCLLAHPEINAKLRELRANPGFSHTLHDNMELTLRRTEREGVVVWRNCPSIKMPMLHENTPMGELLVPSGGFFQVNPGGMEALIRLLREVLAERPRAGLVDLYCGAGLFACVGAEAGVPEIRAVEVEPASVACAQTNLRRCGAPQAKIVAADAEKELPALLSSMPEDTLLVVDPPRAGLSGALIRTINRSALREIVYISCHPATWSRDADRLGMASWKLESLRMINMFPRTGHFELFSRFRRG